MSEMKGAGVALALLGVVWLVSQVLFRVMTRACNNHLAVDDVWCDFGRVLWYASWALAALILLVVVLFAIRLFRH